MDTSNQPRSAWRKLAGRLQRTLRAISPNCREASALQARAFTQPPGGLARLGLLLHLMLCGWCRRYRQQIQFLHQALGQRPPTPPPADHMGSTTLSAEARARLQKAVCQHHSH